MCSVLPELPDWLSGGGGGWLLTSAELYKLEKLLFSSIIIIIRTQYNIHNVLRLRLTKKPTDKVLQKSKYIPKAETPAVSILLK